MNIFRKAKSGMLISGVVLILAGVILLFFPEAMTKTIAYMAAVLLICMRSSYQAVGGWSFAPRRKVGIP